MRPNGISRWKRLCQRSVSGKPAATLASTGFQRGQDLYPPVELGEETNQIGLKAGDLDVGTQRVEGGCGKSDIKFAAKIEDGLGPDVTVKMTMNVG